MKQLGLALRDRKHRDQHPEDPEPSPTAAPLTQAQFHCSICSSQFATAAGLHQHQSMQHRHTTAQLTFQPLRDQVPGQLQCAHCGQPFLTLKALKEHIDGNHCSRTPQRLLRCGITR